MVGVCLLLHLRALVALFREERAHLHDYIVSLLQLSGGGGTLTQRVFVRRLNHGGNLVVAPQRLLAVSQQLVEPRVRSPELLGREEQRSFFFFIVLCVCVCVRGGSWGIITSARAIIDRSRRSLSRSLPVGHYHTSSPARGALQKKAKRKRGGRGVGGK